MKTEIGQGARASAKGAAGGASPAPTEERRIDQTRLNGSVAWDIAGNRDEWGCIDIDPFTIAEAPIVEDPLRQAA